MHLTAKKHISKYLVRKNWQGLISEKKKIVSKPHIAHPSDL